MKGFGYQRRACHATRDFSIFLATMHQITFKLIFIKNTFS